MHFLYQTASGTFWIKHDPGDPEKFLLGFDDITLGKYDTPEAAARDVYTQQTGWDRWDTLMEVSGPEDLSQWMQVE